MPVNVTDYLTKIQDESLATLKQAQDANLAALASLREFAGNVTEKPGEFPTFANVPTPAQIIEHSFDFASRLLDIRKAYTLQLAEYFVEAQKQMTAQVEKQTAEITKVTKAASSTSSASN